MSKAYSIRSQLLRWVLLPMLLLILLDSTVLYHYANKLMQDSLDSELVATADEIGEFLAANSKNKVTELDEDARQDLLKNPTDKTFYNVLDASGNILAGELELKQINTKHNLLLSTKPKFYDSILNKQKIRVARVAASIVIAGKELNLYIQVAETLNKRTQLREKILAWILVPQIILIITASLLLWVGIKKSLNPLLMIDSALTQLNAQDLMPILVSNVPKEVSKLVNSLNGLIFRLNQAMLSQNRFIADAAHQLRTPLAGIRAQVELCDKTQEVAEIRHRLCKVSLSTERLIHLVNQLLVLAKNLPEAAHLVNFKEIDLVGLVKNILLDFESHADNKNIELSYLGLNEQANILGEAARLYDLVYNLIDNAIRYTPSAGKVIVGVSIEGKHIHLTVEDNGVGIAKSEQDSIFERFYRSQQSVEFGTGLGLAIVKEIANLHNATIKVQSYTDSEAKASGIIGTKITIIFPSNSDIKQITSKPSQALKIN